MSGPDAVHERLVREVLADGGESRCRASAYAVAEDAPAVRRVRLFRIEHAADAPTLRCGGRASAGGAPAPRAPRPAGPGGAGAGLTPTGEQRDTPGMHPASRSGKRAGPCQR
ncbi:hypothetical protein CLV92_11172 [Kineococcus xinjiangensis]|uniref:Uncharacterized protein n=1 Tax=Kineococcus xinjiangensis TaxID=512762 RepID=A0A2S6IG14_9ACTN|nr:hypothetical protein [Kineococcus xinjiangensis]PPK93155.1 hypothetical protein CLV92_11172 [Kineococcus xinjiangensis]